MILPHYRNRFFADLAEAFEAEARRRDLCPIVVSTQRDDGIEAKVTRTLLAQRVEFLFIAGVPQPDPLNQLCAEVGVPCVNLDLPGPGAPSVVSDNRSGARRLTEILIGKVAARRGELESFLYLGGVAGQYGADHRVAGFVEGGGAGEYATDNRVAGFVEALRAHDVDLDPDWMALCGYSRARARDALTAHFARHGRLPAGLFINSISALEGAVEFAAGLPHDALNACVVSCFDWDPFAAHLPFDMTMLRQDVETMMEHAFGALTLAHQEARPFVIIPAILV